MGLYIYASVCVVFGIERVVIGYSVEDRCTYSGIDID
jgi:hypothetical protein